MITLAAQIEGLTTRKDRTLKITLGTNELTPAEVSNLIQLNQHLCYVAIKKELFIQEELNFIQDLKTDFENIKSPSQRLRAVLFRNFENNNEGFNDFTSFYISKIDKIIEHYKGKLD